MKNLIILDLDHTLIYGSYAEKETANLLYKHNKFLSVYERPGARDMIEFCKSISDIIVFTTAKRDYAKKISEKLEIYPRSILSRGNCKTLNGRHFKVFKDEWFQKYTHIFILDDSPNVWLNTHSSQIKMLVPTEFRGDSSDNNLFLSLMELQNIIKAQKAFKY
jgi:TFIIF-interacting CTD phosphatase-like protein